MAAKKGSAPKKAAAKKKVEKVMHEWKNQDLKSSSGQKVTDRKQAIAIAMSESGQSKKKAPPKKSGRPKKS